MRSLGKKLLLTAMSTLIALTICELVARYAIGPPPRGNITPVPSEIRMESKLPGLLYRLRPSTQVTHQFPSNPRGYFDENSQLTYRTNSLGFRGRETQQEKPFGVFRILGLGDSFTFGTGVRVEDTFLAIAERDLNANSRKIVFEVLNMGVMGYGTRQEIALLQQVGVLYEPNLVVICFFLNDTQGPSIHSFFNADSRPPGFLASLAKHSVLVDRILWTRERTRQTDQLAESYRESFQPDNPGWLNAQQALQEAKTISNQRGFELVLMIFPVLWNLSADYPFKEIHNAVASFATSNGIRVLDLLHTFAGFDGPELWVHPTNQHPNEVAHALAGEALYHFLLENKLVPLEPNGNP